jgi:hypothetical protein
MKAKTQPFILPGVLLVSHLCILLLLLFVGYELGMWNMHRVNQYYMVEDAIETIDELVDAELIVVPNGKEKYDGAFIIADAIRDPDNDMMRGGIVFASLFAFFLGLLNVGLLSIYLVGFIRTRRHRPDNLNSDAIASG